MTPKGANLEGSDLLEVSTLESGSYVTRSITGQEIIDAAASSGGVTDVTATAPLVSTGGTTPDISIDQADGTQDGYLSIADWNTFNDKQNGLTLTTTGTSGPATLIADTLNIPQYSGGGASGIHTMVQPESGRSTFPSVINATLTTAAVVANRIYLIPYIPNNTVTSQSLYINVSTLAVLTAGKIVIYSNNNGVPDALLYQSTDLDTATLGIKTVTASLTFNAGTTYFIGFWCNGNPSVSQITTSSQAIIGLTGTTLTTYASFFKGLAYGSAPNPFGVFSVTNGNVPFVGIQIA
jgi:hypothetical protein